MQRKIGSPHLEIMSPSPPKQNTVLSNAPSSFVPPPPLSLEEDADTFRQKVYATFTPTASSELGVAEAENKDQNSNNKSKHNSFLTGKSARSSRFNFSASCGDSGEDSDLDDSFVNVPCPPAPRLQS